MSESNIDIRIVFAEVGQRDQLAAFLESYDHDRAAAGSFNTERAQLAEIGLNAGQLFADSSYVSFSHVRPHAASSVDFHLWGGVRGAPALAGALIRAVMPLKPTEVIYADLNDQVMEYGLYYFDGKQSWSYETGMDGEADETIWQADADNCILETVRQLALAGALIMPEFD